MRELLRALVGKVPEAVWRRRAWKRTRRRRRLMLQRAAWWVATHELDAKPPTELHRSLQDVRRSHERFFKEELLPQLGLEPPSEGTFQG